MEGRWGEVRLVRARWHVSLHHADDSERYGTGLYAFVFINIAAKRGYSELSPIRFNSATRQNTQKSVERFQPLSHKGSRKIGRIYFR